MAVNTPVPVRMREQRAREMSGGISCEEGAQVFEMILANPLPQWVVSTHGIDPESVRTPTRPHSPASSRPDAPNGLPAIESTVSRIWQELLGVVAHGADDNFFDLGGDSLLAVQLRSRLESHFARPLRLKALLADPTLRGMTRLLQETA